MFHGLPVFKFKQIFLCLVLFTGMTFPLYCLGFRANIGFWQSTNCGPWGSTNYSTNGVVHAIATDGTNIYIGGNFTTVNGVARDRFAVIDVMGNLAPFNPSFNNIVRTLKISGNTLIVGGAFTSIDGTVRNRIAAFDLTTNSLTSLNPNVGGTVYSMDIDTATNILYFGGSFITVGGASRYNLAAYNLTTNSLVTGFDISVGDTSTTIVYAVDVDGTYLHIGGQITFVGGEIRNRVASILLSNYSVSPFYSDPGSTVYALASDGTRLYIGGTFASKFRVYNIATPTGAAPFSAPANQDVWSIYLDGSKVLVGGNFTTFMGVGRQRFAVIENGVLQSTSYTIPGLVNAILPVTGGYFLGGSFSNVGGDAGRNNFVKLNTCL